jgi:hypothetical protein
MTGMNLGVIVILDALGFKGIWAREDAREVLGRLKSLRRTGLKLQGKDKSGVLLNDYGFRHRVRCMSDTIVITVIVKGSQGRRRALYRAMLSASIIAGSIMMEACRKSPQILFRGCLATGFMKEDVDFLIGPAVDEAAERFEKAHGPFLWLAPSALEITQEYAETYMDRIEPNILVSYSVPLNDGSHVKTQAFNFLIHNEPERRDETRHNLLAAFGSNLSSDAKIKKQNITSFLNHIEHMAVTGSWMNEDFILRLPEWTDLSTSQRLQIVAHGFHWKDGTITSEF